MDDIRKLACELAIQSLKALGHTMRLSLVDDARDWEAYLREPVQAKQGDVDGSSLEDPLEFPDAEYVEEYPAQNVMNDFILEQHRAHMRKLGGAIEEYVDGKRPYLYEPK